MASACPRSSACTPGKAPGVSTRLTTGKPEPVGKPHQADRLPIALRLGHSEIVLEARRGVVALLMADQHDLAAVDRRKPAEDRGVVGEGAVAGQRKEILGKAGDIILEVRPLRMAGDLRLLPRRQLRIGVAQQLGGLGLEPADLGVEVELAGVGRFAQLGDARFKLGDRLFEIEVGLHWRRAGRAGCPARQRRGRRAGGAC